MKDIKDYREKELKNYVVGNILIILVFSGGFDLVFEILTMYSNEQVLVQSQEMITSIISEIIGASIISAIVYIYVFIFDAVLSGDLKFSICYFGKKQPSYTIFTDMKKEVKDDRFTREQVIDKYKFVYEKIESIVDKCLRKQMENAEWYKIYHKHRDEGMISVANRDYLLCRDLCLMSIFFVIVYIFTIIFPPLNINYGVLLFIAMEYLVTLLAVRSKGKRLAYNVIAADISAEDESK